MAVAVKEHPIIFSAEMVRAILDGRKTQTRRVINPQPIYQKGQLYSLWVWNKKSIPIPEGIREGIDYALWWDKVKNPESIIHFCPYGQVGDRLWVRETFCDSCVYICFKAGFELTGNALCVGPKWKSGRFLHKMDARLWLDITGIRVERLQEITNLDAEREGLALWGFEHECPSCDTHNHSYYGGTSHFAQLWNSINAKYPWESNPWVWVIEFRRLDGK